MSNRGGDREHAVAPSLYLGFRHLVTHRRETLLLRTSHVLDLGMETKALERAADDGPSALELTPLRLEDDAREVIEVSGDDVSITSETLAAVQHDVIAIRQTEPADALARVERDVARAIDLALVRHDARAHAITRMDARHARQ